MFFPILSNLTAILARQRSIKGQPDPDSQTTWDWGWRINPVTHEKQWHNGIDLPAPTGTPIYAPLDGIVEKAAFSDVSGNYLRITHDDPDFTNVYQTRYAHLSKMDVSTGQHVTKGQKIGEVGSTGRSTGPHLHFIVRLHESQYVGGSNRADTDPLPFLEGGSAVKKTLGFLVWGAVFYLGFKVFFD